VRRRGLWYNPSACRNVGRVNRVCARAPEQRTATTRATVRAALLGAILVAFMTAPMITRPASVGRLDTNDGHYAIWNVAWVAHAILDPEARVFDANIFAPHRGTLAYSEMNLVAGVLALPWYAATHDPLVALNGTVFVALVLAFVLTSVLVRRLTGSEGAGLVAATAFTFCPYVAAHTAHIQLLMIWVFPLVMLAFHAFEERPGAWRGGRPRSVTGRWCPGVWLLRPVHGVCAGTRCDACGAS
jgi:uncharacterized membrane protein YhaH (DUF805 family)